MIRDFTQLRLGDVCAKIGSGATPRGGSDVYLSDGVALIRSQNVYNDRFQCDGLAYIGEKHADELANVTVEANDVLLNITGDSVARCCLAPADILPARVNQHVAIIRPHPDKLDARYLRYYLVNPSMQQYLLMFAGSGATRNALTKAMIEDFAVPAPPLAEQKAIAHVLGTLDDKIELNRRMNETLEAIARAIFKSWFVDFDPVHAKAARRKPPGLDAATAALFADSFQESPLGPIPKGWSAGYLGDAAENPRRGVSPDEIDAGTPYIALEHMPRRCIALDQWGDAGEVVSGKFRFNKGEILFGKLRPYFHKVGVAPVDGVCSTDILVIAPKSPDWLGFVLGHVSSDEFVAHTDAVSTGTKMPRANWQDMARYEVALPPEELAAAFTCNVRPLIDRIHANTDESRTLAAMRDALLPKLMSGEIEPLAGVEISGGCT